MRNKLYLTLLACSICFTGYTGWFGSTIRKPSRALPLHAVNYSSFISGYKPDSAVLVYRQPKYFGTPRDSMPYLFDIVGSSVLSNKKTELDFIRDASLNRQLIERLIAIKEVAYYRLFYRNAAGQVFKYEDLDSRGRKIREGILSDAMLPSMELLKFYENGNVSNRTQYRCVQPDSLEKRKYDSLWYDLNPRMLKSGREEIYYPNRNPMLVRVYDDGLLRDSLYKELHRNGMVRKTYATKNGLLQGTARSFDQEGKLREELVFDRGKIVKKVLAGRNFDDNRKAFLFGIDNYAVPSGVPVNKAWKIIPWANLAGCVNDVDTLQKVLVNYNGFSSTNITIVTDEQATREKTLNALRRFAASLRKGDIVFIHFSGHGNLVLDQPDSLRRYEGLALPCRDANYPADPALSASNYIFQYQLEDFFNRIKKVIGRTGQLIISLDASHSGQLLTYQSDDTTKNTGKTIASRGESNNLLFNLVKDESVPVIIYTGTTSQQFGFEMQDDRGRTYGAYTLALANTLSSPWTLNSAEVHDAVDAFLRTKVKNQTPGYLANETQFLFESPEKERETDQGMVSQPDIKPSGHTFLLSVGISDYAASGRENLSFKNCEADARAYADFFQQQYSALGTAGDNRKLHSSLLINREATREQIIGAINDAISHSKPDDYFIFNFSGYCRPLRDSTGKQLTWFVPYGLKSFNDSAEIVQKGIPLTQLKDLLQMIPANNQLFITEAGPTDDFQREFIQALIETSPTIASLSNKNRVFIVPRGTGLDDINCRGASQGHGPINYFITHLSEDLNIYGLFSGGVYAHAVKYNLEKMAMECNFFRTAYFDVFFERDFIRDLRYFLPEEVMQSRGAGLINKDKAAVAGAIAKKYALLVGTNTYTGKPQWTDLEGIPVTDVTSIGSELKNNFGFEVITLVDKPSDSIYENIIRLSKLLKPNDQLLIYVAGHGDYDEQLFDDGFIVCTNSKQAKDDPYRNTFIQYSKLSRMINKLPARQVMMVLDVCFGGSFADKVVRCVNRSGYEDLSAADYVADKLKLKTRLFLSSGGKKEVPNGYKGRLSPFAQRFLQCLQTKGGDGKLLSSANFYEFVKKLPSGPVIGSFGDDECGSEFLMLAK